MARRKPKKSPDPRPRRRQPPSGGGAVTGAERREFMAANPDYDGTPADSEIRAFRRRGAMSGQEQEQQRIRALTKNLAQSHADPMSNYNLYGEFGEHGQGMLGELRGLLEQNPDYSFEWNTRQPNGRGGNVSQAEMLAALGVTESPSFYWDALGGGTDAPGPIGLNLPELLSGGPGGGGFPGAPGHKPGPYPDGGWTPDYPASIPPGQGPPGPPQRLPPGQGPVPQRRIPPPYPRPLPNPGGQPGSTPGTMTPPYLSGLAGDPRRRMNRLGYNRPSYA